MICCIVALLLSGLLQQGDSQTKWDNVYDMPRFVNYETSGIIVKDMPKLECGKADTFDVREISADSYVDLTPSAAERLMDVLVKSLFSDGDYADYICDAVGTGWNSRNMPEDLWVYKYRVGINKSVDSYILKVRNIFWKDRLYLVNIKDDELKSIMDISKDAVGENESYDHRYVKTAGSKIEVYEKAYIERFSKESLKTQPYCHLATVELNSKGCLSVADTYCELFKEHSEYQHRKFDDRVLRKRAWNEDFNYRGVSLKIPGLSKLKEIHLDSLSVPAQQIKTDGLTPLSSKTLEVLGRELDYDWRRMKFYYYGRINLTEGIDSYLIYGQGAWNSRDDDMKIIRAMYLVNLKEGMIKSLVPVSRYCYEDDKFCLCTVLASCSWFFNHRFELGYDSYGDSPGLCPYVDNLEAEFGPFEKKEEKQLLEEHQKEMINMGRNAACSRSVEFILGSDGYVEYRKITEGDLWFPWY